MNQVKQTIRTFVRFNNRTSNVENIHSSQHYKQPLHCKNEVCIPYQME